MGIDYAQASMDLAKHTLAARGRPPGAWFVRCDAGRMPFPDASFDLAYAMDFVEHLTPDELDRALAEVVRVLRPGAPLVIHTMPNRLIYDVTYPVLRFAARLTGRRWPADPRHPFEHQMHVNEMRRGELRPGAAPGRVPLGEGLGGAFWYGHFIPSERARDVFGRMAKSRLLRRWRAARSGPPPVARSGPAAGQST